MSRNYENINELDRKSLEALLTKITYDAYNKGVNFGLLKGDERTKERIIAMKKEIINCVIDYGLTPEVYERVCNDIDAVIKGENK